MTRVTMINGWAVADCADGGQKRVKIETMPYSGDMEPARGEGWWNEGVSLVVHRAPSLGGGLTLDDHDGLARVMDRVEANRDGTVTVYADPYDEGITEDGTAHCDLETFVRRYLRAFWGVQYVALEDWSGYSQSDWLEVWVIAEGIEDGDAEDIAKQTWREWGDWARGDVYLVEAQERACDVWEDEEDGWADEDYPMPVIGDDEARRFAAEALGEAVEDMPSFYQMAYARD